MNAFWSTAMSLPAINESIELDSTTVDEMEKSLAGSEYHMGDFVSLFRIIRDTLYSYERHQHPSHNGQSIHLIQKEELENLILIFCGVIKSMKKREAYLEGRMEELQTELDGQQMIKDDWVMVGKDEIPENYQVNMNSKSWWPRRRWI